MVNAAGCFSFCSQQCFFIVCKNVYPGSFDGLLYSRAESSTIEIEVDDLKEENITKIEKDTADWQYMDQLPAEWFGFNYRKDMCVKDDIYKLYSYINPTAHRSLTAYFHEETHEYKLRVRIGLTEFCRIEFIAPDLQAFEKLLKEQLEAVLHDLSSFNPATINRIVRDKHILEWDYAKLLPESLEGFQLFIRPSQPVRVLNGSYIVFDYSDFSAASNFIIYYNMFRDEFFGEARINNIPDVNYTFDATELPELEEKLDANLRQRLQGIRIQLAAQLS